MPSISVQLEELKQQFLRELPERLGSLVELMGGAITNDRAALNELQLRTHNLVSAAEIFGYTGLGKKAKEFDLFLAVLNEGGDSSSASLPSQMWPFVRQFIGDLTKMQENIAAESTISLEAQTQTADIALEPQSILFCTSDDLSGGAIAAVLSEFDHSVELVGPDSLTSRVEASEPDFILLSLTLAGANGRDLAREIRAVSSSPYIPIIFVTPHTDSYTLTSCVAAGGDDVIHIPFETQVLLTRMYALKRLVCR